MEPNGELIDRRAFLGRVGVVAAGGFLAGCGAAPMATPIDSIAPSTSLPSTSLPGAPVGPATVGRQAQRGESFQAMTTLPPPQTWRPGQFVTHVDVATRRMALTFDDGPSPYNTESVLRTLDDFGVRATFFLIGVNVRSWPDIARRTHEAGHELGNHSVYHTPYRSAELASQIGPNQSIIEAATGYRPTASRAPGLTRGQAILDTCAYYGMYEVHTHMATYDWISPRHSASTLAYQFTRDHRNGAFPIYHDGGGRRPTPAALPSIISYGQSIGYEFVTATELMMSGVPQPATTRDATQSDSPGPDVSPRLPEANEPYVDVCGYDAEAELRAVVEGDLPIDYSERMRIVEVLADIESQRKESR